MDNVPSACLFCCYGKVVPPTDGSPGTPHLTPSAIGQHLDLLLPDFRSARRSNLHPARQAHDHPLPIIQHARSQASISRMRPIDWTPATNSRPLHDVLSAFAEHVILPFPQPDHNPFARRCRPEWWMSRVHDVETIYIADGDHAAMLARVDDIIETALRRMHEDELPRHGRHHLLPGHRFPAADNRPEPGTPAFNMVLGQRVLAPDNRASGLSAGISAATGNTSVRQLLGDHSVNANTNTPDDQDEPQLPAPAPRARARRNKVKNEPVETIDLVSSSPPAAAAAAAAVPEEPEPGLALLLTLSVKVFGSTVPVRVTLGMGLRDAVAGAVAGSMLAGAEPGRFWLRGEAGEVWDEVRWAEVWEEGMSGRCPEGNAWKVELVPK